jgi:2-dehydro-3-deoxygalactonokinase
MIIAVVDIGTTNSRVRLIKDMKIIAISKSTIGIKDVSITGKKDLLMNELEKLTGESLLKAGKRLEDIEYFVASGMVTSELGLCEIPHKISPVSETDLSRGIIKKSFEKLGNIPFYFIPGVKNKIDINNIDSLAEMDMMRGEEVETFGVLELCKVSGPFIVILPGSHSKIVYVDNENKIEKCSSSMAGELIQAITSHTILAQCLKKKLVSYVDEEYLLRGLKFEEENSLTKAIFAVRLMNTLLDTTENQRANFLAGAIISNDISRNLVNDIKAKNYKRIYIGGSNQLKYIFEVILKSKISKEMEVVLLNDEITEMASPIGAIKIANMAHIENTK